MSVSQRGKSEFVGVSPCRETGERALPGGSSLFQKRGAPSGQDTLSERVCFGIDKEAYGIRFLALNQKEC